MAISRVASYNWTSGTSLAISTPTTGDLILAFVYKDGANSAPPTPTGFTVVNNSTGANSNSAGLFYKISTGAETSVDITGTFTSMIVVVYRGTNTSNPIGGVAIAGSTATSVTYQGFATTKSDGTSWLVGCAGHRSINTTLETPPSGMSFVTGSVDATDEAAWHDTNGGVSSWGGGTVAVGGTASGWRTITFEILAYDPTKYVTAAIAESLAVAVAATLTPPTTGPGSIVLSGYAGVSTTTGSLAVPKPTGLAAGDYWFVAMEADNASAVHTPSSTGTWVQIGSMLATTVDSGSTTLYYKVATGSEGSTETFSTSAGNSAAYSWRGTGIAGINTSSSAIIDTGANPQTFTGGTLTSTVPCKLMWVAASDMQTASLVTWTAPTGYSGLNSYLDTASGWNNFAVADKRQTAAGSATGTGGQGAGGAIMGAMAFLVALAPSATSSTKTIAFAVAETQTISPELNRLRAATSAIAEAYGYTFAIDKTSSIKYLTLSLAVTGAYGVELERARDTAAALSEVLTYAATIQRGKTVELSSSESTALAAVAARARRVSTALTDTTVVDGSINRTRLATASVTEAQVLTEAIIRVRDVQTALTEQLSQVFSAARRRDIQQMIDELEVVAAQAMKVKLLGLLIAETQSTSNVIVNRVRNHTFTVSQLEGVQATFGRVRDAIITVPEAESVSIHFGRIRDEALDIAETESVDAAMVRVRGVLQDIANVTGYTFTLSNLISQDSNNLTIVVSWEEWVYANGALTLTPRSSNLVFKGKTASSITLPAPGESIIVIPDPLYSDITMP